MKNKNPPFEITNEIVALIGKISEATGRISILQPHPNPVLRKSNRIRTVHGSLAIEQNTLSLEQVTAVLDGKRVIAPPRDIAEVKNTFEIYDNMALLDPYSMNDLLKAHGVMMRGLMDHPGSFRTKPAGVADQHGNIIHFGTLPQNLPGLVSDLIVWTEMSAVHPLIKSCVFNYEFELIHPFLDGNGRLGRLWHTLLLSRWNSVFAWLPIESIIHDSRMNTITQ
jgi:Fic family protein